jgi:hypothetical protein
MADIMVGEDPYTLPALDTFDIDETIVFYDYTGLTFDQAFEVEGLNPKVVKALLHVAFQRKNPDLRDKDIEEIVGRVNMMAVLEQLAEAANPTTAEAPDSSKSSSESTDSSGLNGSGDSAHSPEKSTPASTGAPDSETDSDSVPATSAA